MILVRLFLLSASILLLAPLAVKADVGVDPKVYHEQRQAEKRARLEALAAQKNAPRPVTEERRRASTPKPSVVKHKVVPVENAPENVLKAGEHAQDKETAPLEPARSEILTVNAAAVPNDLPSETK
ncbi:MAG: hypothetical protein HQL16_02585 [Candidatus Omnitrophica bacterium]|nr:hypothetical protein [Candidatus Omnitrophota bacterium]